MRVEANWTPSTVDEVLEAILPLENKGVYERTCASLAEDVGAGVADVKMGSGMVRDGDPVNWLFWAMSLRIKEYDGPATEYSRRKRTGPFTWVEKMMIRWAVNGKSSKQQMKPNASYLARLLQRDVPSIEQEMYKLGPAKGRIGFFGGVR